MTLGSNTDGEVDLTRGFLCASEQQLEAIGGSDVAHSLFSPA